MSLYGVLRSGVSGMNAQSNKLGTVAENVQNSATTGYKRASTEFQSLILNSGSGSYNPGGVQTKVRYAIGDQGAISYTMSDTDLAVSGNGFFVVSDPNGTPLLTRAGNFVVDGATGNLRNAAGFTLMGYSLANGPATPALNSLNGMVPVNIKSLGMEAKASTTGTFAGNLPYIPENGVPGEFYDPGGFSKNSSLVVFDKVGQPVKLDISIVGTPPTARGVMGTYDVTVTGPDVNETITLRFDNDGQLTTKPASLNFTVTNGEPFTLDLSGMTQLAGPYDVKGTANGNAPSAVKDTEFARDGTVYAVYEDGSRIAAYRIPLATVASPDNLHPLAGNAYEATAASGGYQVGFPETGAFGTLSSGALESSNVDIGTELTSMIEAQTAYTANSKVFQTGSELLDVLMSLKR
ncbi:flagellar hook protein FlgE [Microvirga massiliensis]|uniref:flagellar hook protein FlgE n=1 Tax=Microvirga massiliensis TaxID=1033741 RepID=UPI00062B9BDB|nr:flagellar hook protein FlgE [Microvirga massiliensis]